MEPTITIYGKLPLEDALERLYWSMGDAMEFIKKFKEVRDLSKSNIVGNVLVSEKDISTLKKLIPPVLSTCQTIINYIGT